MSVRLRSVAATVAAAGLLTAGAAALPAAANAATPAAAPKAPLAVSLTELTPGKALQPGGAAESVVLKVTNTTGHAESVKDGWLGFFPQGAVALQSGELTVKVAPLGHTPATATGAGSVMDQRPGVVGAFFPKGHPNGSFTLPAHATFAWDVSVAATKSFPLNDNGVQLSTGLIEGHTTVQRSADIKVGDKRTGGPLLQRLVGSNAVAPGKPAYEWVVVTNRTGAALKGWIINAGLAPVNGAQLAADVWVGSAKHGRWESLDSLKRGVVLPEIANGAAYALEVRIDVVKESPSFHSAKTWFGAANWQGVLGPEIGEQQITVLR